MKPCPVCGHQLTITKDKLEGIILEEWEECDNCKYSNGYAFGGYLVCVGDKAWEWYYTDAQEKIVQFQDEIKKEIEKIHLILNAKEA